ncbi:MAG: hypothetical protein R3E63_10100 [Pseudomonadales bacterium]
MPRNEDDIFDSHAIIPDTEDRLARNSSAKPAAAMRTAEKKKITANTAPNSRFTHFLLLIILGVMLLISGFLHYRITQQTDASNKLQTRLETLESQLGISITDNKKTGDTMGDKINKLDARLNSANKEINQLTATLNDKTKKALDTQEKSLNTLQANLAELKKSLAQTDKQNGEVAKLASDSKQTADRATASLTALNSAVTALQQRVAQGDPAARDAGRQATMALEQNDQLQKKLG